jgi:hypothetical protein
MGTEEAQIQTGTGRGCGRPEPAGLGYYLRRRHELIRRHVETISLNPDHTARWTLRIDFELPTDEEARLDERDGEALFSFPLVFLRKAEARPGFQAHDGHGADVQIPIREECDAITAAAAAHAANSLLAKMAPPPPAQFELGELEEALRLIPAGRPFDSSISLQILRRAVGLEKLEAGEEGETYPEIGASWSEAGLTEVLQMLVEHSLVWIAVRGRPGERRSVTLSKQITLSRRAALRWAFGRLRVPKYPRLQRFRARHAAERDGRRVLMIAGEPYGRRKRTISFSALGERIGQPLAWMPFEFEFPTIYTKRCASYHFQVSCPPGRSPRDLKPAADPPLAEPVHDEGDKEEETAEPLQGRKTLTSRVARFDLPGDRLPEDTWFRVTVGVGNGAFPVLWVGGGAVTALLLWIFAGADPTLKGSQNEIAAAILLIVPVLVASLAIGGSEVPLTQLIGGARILLMVTGLSAVVAASVLAGARPFDMQPTWTWTACAMAATAATIPLGTSWLLSIPLVWRQMKLLGSRRRQQRALWALVAMALVAVAALSFLDDERIARGAIAVYLLLLAVAMTVVANDRAAMAIGKSRRYVAVCFLIAGFTCLALACIELRATICENSHLQTWAERGAALALVGSLFAGEAISALTKKADPAEDEVHVSPAVGRAMLAGETVRELTILREREATS